MSERYSKLFSLPENLYSNGSPVVVAAGALLKDNQTGKVIAQLKIQNISPNSIKAIKVCIHLFDIAGNPLGNDVEHMYLDLKASRDEYFGQKTPIVLPDATARGFSVDVTEVVFTNNSVWQGVVQLREKMPSPMTLVSYLNNSELIRQYRIKFGTNCEYEPMAYEDLWYCTCGSINHKDEHICHQCRKNAASLMNADLDALKQERDERVAAEQKKAEEERAVATARAKKTKSVAIILGVVICAVITFTFLLNYVKYTNALALMNAGKYAEAITAFEALNGYKDCEIKIDECNTLILDDKYNVAIALMKAGKYTEAIAAFEALNGYKESKDKIYECKDAIKITNLQSQYNEAVNLMNQGETAKAAIAFGKLPNYKESLALSFILWDKITNGVSVIADPAITVGLKADGTVVATGANKYGECNLYGWTQIVAISESNMSHTVGLKADGTVVAKGDNYFGQCNVSDWKDIIAIDTGFQYTVGLTTNRTVVATGYINNNHVRNWRDIVAVSAGYMHIVGLKANGTVVAAGDNDYGQCNVNSWRDIVAIYTSSEHTVGLKADGTVVAVGDNSYGECNVSSWKNIVTISVELDRTVGLKADGTVVAVGRNKEGQCNVKSWKNIVAISAAGWHTVGLKSDGTVVAAGSNSFGQRNVSSWKNIVAISAGDSSTVGLKADGTVVAVGQKDYGVCNVQSWRGIKVPKRD